MRLPAFLVIAALAVSASVFAESVKISPSDKGMKIEVDGKFFSEYIVKDTPRPYLYPVIGAAGESVVRNFPMVKDVPGEPTDHKHHRSLWFAHGLVNGMDFWSEDKDFGTQQSVKLEGVALASTEPSNAAAFVADTKWVTHDGQCIMTDTRIITVTALPDGEKYLDFDITLKASEGADVVMGDTKEGSMAMRLCPSLELPSSKLAAAQGHAYNSADVKGKDIWGKPANWVCYFGPDTKGNTVGVAMFSHPTNLRSPQTWHARDYGLFAVNPFGLHDFEGLKKGDQDHKGDYTIKKGESLRLRYRFYFANGKPKPAALEAKFQEYSAR